MKNSDRSKRVAPPIEIQFSLENSGLMKRTICEYEAVLTKVASKIREAADCAAEYGLYETNGHLKRLADEMEKPVKLWGFTPLSGVKEET